jgi:hypothetical protein
MYIGIYGYVGGSYKLLGGLMLSSEVNSPDFICLFSSVWLIKLICVSPCIFNAFDFIGLSETIVINETKSANCVKDEQRLSRLSDILNRILDFLGF